MRGAGNRWRSAVAVLGVAGALVAPAGAHAAFFGEAADPAGDSADPTAHPARDLLAAGLGYDRRSGSLVAAVRLAGAPAGAPALVTVFAGTQGPQGCNVYPAVGLSADTDGYTTRWHRLDGAAGNDGGHGVIEGSGQPVQLYKAERRTPLQGVRPNCAIATLGEFTGGVVYDSIAIPLTARAELEADLRGVPKRFAPGRSRQVSVRLSNPGDASTGRVKLRFTAPGGVKVHPRSVRVKPVKAGGRRTVKVRVTLSAKAESGARLTAIATARGGLEARVSDRLYKRAPKSSGGGGGGGGSKTCVRWIPDFSGETGGSLGLLPC